MFGGSRGRVAEAQLRLDISPWQRGATAALAISRTLRNGVQTNLQSINSSLGAGTTRAVSQVAQGFREATRAADEFAKTDTGRLVQGINQVERGLRGVSVAAGLIAAIGIKEAGNLQRQNALLKIFSRTQEGLVSNQEQIRDFAAETSQSYLTTLEAANQILPTINRYKIDLGGVLSIIQRLALLDPLQGTQGAAFAIREALSGQGRSLAARFELPLSQVNGIIKGAAGDPQKIIEGLDGLVNQLGLTEEAFLELQNSGVNSLQRLSGTLREAIGTAFTPALTQVIIPFADGLNRLLTELNATNPQLLALAGTGVILVAALSPVLLILGKLITAFGIISTFLGTGTGASIVAGLKSFAAAAIPFAAATGAGLAGGIVGGTALAQGLANNGIGDQRLRSDSGENPFAVLFERLKQYLFIVVTQLVGAVSTLVMILKKAGVLIEFALSNLDTILQIGGTLIAEAFASVVVKIGDILVSLGSILGAFGGTEANALGEALRLIGNAGISDAQDNRAALEAGLNGTGKLDQQIKAIELESANFIRDFGRSALEFFAIGITESVDEAERPLTFISQIFGTMREAGTGLVAALNATIPAMIDAAAKEKELNDERAITIQRLTEQRQIEDDRQAFDDNLSDYRKVNDFRRSIQSDDAAFYDDRLRDAQNFATTLQDEESDNLIDRAELQRNFHQEELRDTEEQGRKLERIERETRENVQKAARKLDASGVSEAYRAGKRQMDEASEQSTTERKRRLEDYTQRLEDFDRNAQLEKDRRIRDFNTQRAEAESQYIIRRNERLREFNQQMNEEAYDRSIRNMRRQEDRIRQDRIEQEDYSRRITALWNTVYTESMLWSNLRDVVTGASAGIRSAIASLFLSPPTALGAAGGSRGASLNPGTGRSIGTSAIQSSFPTLSSTSRQTAGGGIRYGHYAMGGTPPLNQPVLVGERGVEVVQFTSPVKIHSSESSATRGMGRGGAGLMIGNFAPVFGIPNLDSVALELHMRIEATIQQFANEYVARRA